MRLVGIAAGLAVLAASAPAALAADPGNGDPNRQICKSKPVVGSRLKRVRECHSAAEWEEMMRAERLGLSTKQFNGDAALGVRESYLPPGRSLEMPN